MEENVYFCLLSASPNPISMQIYYLLSPTATKMENMTETHICYAIDIQLEIKMCLNVVMIKPK